jgi:hypothetical protein
MNQAGFKTEKYSSLKRQINAYGFKHISVAEAGEKTTGWWFHPSNGFTLEGSTDHVIGPRFNEFPKNYDLY